MGISLIFAANYTSNNFRAICIHKRQEKTNSQTIINYIFLINIQVFDKLMIAKIIIDINEKLRPL